LRHRGHLLSCIASAFPSLILFGHENSCSILPSRPHAMPVRFFIHLLKRGSLQDVSGSWRWRLSPSRSSLRGVCVLCLSLSLLFYADCAALPSTCSLQHCIIHTLAHSERYAAEQRYTTMMNRKNAQINQFQVYVATNTLVSMHVGHACTLACKLAHTRTHTNTHACFYARSAVKQTSRACVHACLQVCQTHTNTHINPLLGI
jgi:hypothetical protein